MTLYTKDVVPEFGKPLIIETNNGTIKHLKYIYDKRDWEVVCDILKVNKWNYEIQEKA